MLEAGTLFGHPGDRLCPDQAIKEVGDVDIEEACHLPQLGSGDAIGPLFVFLDLLKRHINRPAEIALVETKFDPFFADPSPYVTVYRVRTFGTSASGHFFSSFNKASPNRTLQLTGPLPLNDSVLPYLRTNCCRSFL
jgi:hypothetical protein